MSPSTTTPRAGPVRADAGPGWRRVGRIPWRARYAFGLGLALVVQALAGGVAKLAAGRTDDLAHTAVHLVSGASALVAFSRRTDGAARAFAAAFAAFYLGLAVLGWTGSPIAAALHLAGPDHVFHTVVGALSGAVAAWPNRATTTAIGAAP